jgi:sortase (surface protein transpeptidase)
MRPLRLVAGLVALAGLLPSIALAYSGPVATPLKPRAEAPARPASAAGLPVRLKIPSVGIDAAVENVGLTEDGAMESPQDYFDVGWYQLGYRPGQVGNAVMAGHIDSAKFGAAVFYPIRSLKPGALVYVIDEEGFEIAFRVMGVTVYPDSDAPISDIFGPADTANLNLITCVGTFDRSAGQYDQRLVVYTTLVTDGPEPAE